MASPATPASAPDDDVDPCSICLEVLNKPVQLPCRHSFCTDCLEKWRSKYDTTSQRGCPQCRSKLPPTREMISQINMLKSLCQKIEYDIHNTHPLPVPLVPGEPGYGDRDMESLLLSLLHRLSLDDVRDIRQFDDDFVQQQALMRGVFENALQEHRGDLAEMVQAVTDSGHEHLLESSNQNNTNEEEDDEDLPWEINRAAGENDIPTVLKWLGPHPETGRLNAKCQEHMDRTLLHEAEYENHTRLMSLLLQMGANVDPKSSFGATPFEQAVCFSHLEEAARLLLTWGAAVTNGALERMTGPYKGEQPALLKLVGHEFGGRRCEIWGLQMRPDLNGRTGIAARYMQDKERYVLELEDFTKKETVLIRRANLLRRDRTPLDPGVVTIFEGVMPNGSNAASEGFLSFKFSSVEEAQKFYDERRQRADEEKIIDKPLNNI